MAIRNPVQSESASVTQGIQNPPTVTEVRTPEGWTATWATLGVYVGPAAPATGVVFEQWLAGAPGYWAWIQT
jgi:hypothetical protein